MGHSHGPRTARAIDLATGERCEGPVFLTAEGHRLDRYSAGRIVRRVARRAGITKTAPSAPGVSYAVCEGGIPDPVTDEPPFGVDHSYDRAVGRLAPNKMFWYQR